jgi:hypothetical protein
VPLTPRCRVRLRRGCRKARRFRQMTSCQSRSCCVVPASFSTARIGCSTLDRQLILRSTDARRYRRATDTLDRGPHHLARHAVGVTPVLQSSSGRGVQVLVTAPLPTSACCAMIRSAIGARVLKRSASYSSGQGSCAGHHVGRRLRTHAGAQRVHGRIRQQIAADDCRLDP